MSEVILKNYFQDIGVIFEGWPGTAPPYAGVKSSRLPGIMFHRVASVNKNGRVHVVLFRKAESKIEKITYWKLLDKRLIWITSYHLKTKKSLNVDSDVLLAYRKFKLFPQKGCRMSLSK